MKPAARYAVRAVKYFCWFAILFVLIISVLVFAKFVPADISQMFIHGWWSVAEIAGIVLIFSLLYPRFGYQKRMVSITGEWSEVSERVKDFFANRGYRIEAESPDEIRFRSTQAGVRIARLWEDRITVTPTLGGVEVEGPSKDLARIVSAMEYRFTEKSE